MAAHGVSFSGCRFRHLGGSGLWLDAGSQRCSVTGSHFTDLSGAGVMVGGIGDPAQDNASLFTAANTVSGNTIVNVSQEYHGTAALIVGYATGTTLSHNLIANVSQIALEYAVAVTGTASFLELEDCGADFKCGTADDTLLYRFAASSLNITGGTVILLDCRSSDT